LFGDDYSDYYCSKTTELSGKLQPVRGLCLSGSAGSSYYSSLERNAVFYLFGHDSNAIRANPEVNKGEDRYLRAGVEWNDVNAIFPRSGICARATGQYSGGRINSQFTYRKAVLDLKAYRPVSPSTEFSFGLYTGEVSGKAGRQAIALQKLFDFGGIGTVRGLPFRGDTNWLNKDRIVAVSVEARMRAGSVLKGLAPSFPSLFNERSLFLCAFDAGNAWNTSYDNIGFDNLFTDMKLGRFHKSVTLGLASPNENFRLEFSRAFRGDKSQTLDAITLRINPCLN
jgi:outer membrane protein assembly factor BamA